MSRDAFDEVMSRFQPGDRAVASPHAGIQLPCTIVNFACAGPVYGFEVRFDAAPDKTRFVPADELTAAETEGGA